jgi:hypothetical protein
MNIGDKILIGLVVVTVLAVGSLWTWFHFYMGDKVEQIIKGE